MVDSALRFAVDVSQLWDIKPGDKRFWPNIPSEHDTIHQVSTATPLAITLLGGGDTIR